DDEFEEKELEDWIYRFLEVEEQNESSEEDDEDKGYENLNLNNLGEGEAWWNLNSDNDYLLENDHDWNQEEEYHYEAESLNNEWNEESRADESPEVTLPDLAIKEYEEIADLFDFYFDKEENPVAMYNVETLPKEQEEKIEVILDKNPDLFLRVSLSLAELIGVTTE
ncbi:13464_t:CDS:1, partial [Dentiscutata heterogama]